ncbi:MAG: alpha/beta hydrolase [Clostridia bacterium]|nr:alpha/beta hydrolase [Clostridia bacterium]
MTTQTFNLWENTPGMAQEIPDITYYQPENKLTDAAVVIFPGGGYSKRAPHEGKVYAEFSAGNGIPAFVVGYRVSPHHFPLPLLDARRAVRYVRYNAEKFGVDKNKIAVMGSSAGGHLAAFVSTYTEPVEFEGADDIDKEEFLPNAQILCYPVINLYDLNIAHIGSGDNLIGDKRDETNDVITRRKFSPNLLVSEKTPQAFIWHTFEDQAVDVRNSLEYASSLREYGVAAEMHIFPHGYHGLGLTNRSNDLENHVAQWGDMLLTWIKYIGW